MTVSPASNPIVATLPAVLVFAPPPMQTRLVSDQPPTAASVTVFTPSCAAGKVNVRVLGSVTSASSNEKPAVNAAGPVPVVVNAKSCASSGIASLIIVIVASLVLV